MAPTVISEYSVKYQGKYREIGKPFEMDKDDADDAIRRKKVRLVTGADVSPDEEPGEKRLEDMTMNELKALAKDLDIDVDAIKGTGKGGNLLVADVRGAIAALDEVDEDPDGEPEEDGDPQDEDPGTDVPVNPSIVE